MKKIFRPLIVLGALLVLGFGFYIYKLHSLAVEGNKIFEYRCLNVNPHLISYKNSFLKFTYFLESPDTYAPDEVQGFVDTYISEMREYIPEEEKWLKMQKQYVDRWDFKLIERGYIKEVADYQLKMYEGYYEDAKSILEVYDHPELAENTLSPDAVSNERKRRDIYTEVYFENFSRAQEIFDWRKFFTSVPPPQGCTEENLIIPDTSGSIDWDGKSPAPTMPVDKDSAT